MYHYIISNRITSSMKELEFTVFVKASENDLKSTVLQKFKKNYPSLKSKAKEIIQISKNSFEKESNSNKVIYL